MNDHRRALILSGGGAYGAYEVGVMKALFNGESPSTNFERLKIEISTGTSVGAFNSSMISMNPSAGFRESAAQLEKVWKEQIGGDTLSCGNGVFRIRGNPAPYVSPTCLLQNPMAPFQQFTADAAFFADYFLKRGVTALLTSGGIPQRLAQFVDFSALISIEPLRQLIERNVDFTLLRSSPVALRVVATNWMNGQAVVFGNHDLSDEYGSRIIQASAAIPGLFPPVQIGKDVYVDGGVVMNTPLSIALAEGATEMHIVYMDPDPENIPLRRLQNTIETFDRIYTIMLATKINEDIATAAWVNEGLQAVHRMAHSRATAEDMKLFIRVAGQIEKHLGTDSEYHQVTIHRYHPHEDLGGATGMLDFRPETIDSLIETGFADAVRHNCEKSHCVLPVE